MSETAEDVDITRIMEMIPHRYPILLVDRIVALERNVSATGLKNVSINEPFFQGHFPGHPVMPGVLIVEAMAQTAAVMAVASMGADAANKLIYFMGIENARFRRPVRPGDQLRLSVEKERSRGNFWRFKGTAGVDGQTAANATFSATMVDQTDSDGA